MSTTDERARFRFAPAPSVPEVALMASKFRRAATEIDGVTFEVLLHPDHDRNLEVLAGSRKEIEQWVAERLEVAARAGLAYPFDAFTIVEVPNALRSYVGSWQLETTLAPPAMMLLRETSFPTARFDVDVFARFGKRDLKAEGGAARVNRNRLVNFFSNDVSGGNVFTGAARSFFAHRTAAVDEGAIPLNFVLQELATLLVSGRPSYFSAHAFANVSQVTTSAVTGLTADSNQHRSPDHRRRGSRTGRGRRCKRNLPSRPTTHRASDRADCPRCLGPCGPRVRTRGHSSRERATGPACPARRRGG